MESFELLDDDSLRYIFQLLTPPDLAATKLVCRLLCSAASHEATWQSLCARQMAAHGGARRALELRSKVGLQSWRATCRFLALFGDCAGLWRRACASVAPHGGVVRVELGEGVVVVRELELHNRSGRLLEEDAEARDDWVLRRSGEALCIQVDVDSGRALCTAAESAPSEGAPADVPAEVLHRDLGLRSQPRRRAPDGSDDAVFGRTRSRTNAEGARATQLQRDLGLVALCGTDRFLHRNSAPLRFFALVTPPGSLARWQSSTEAGANDETLVLQLLQADTEDAATVALAGVEGVHTSPAGTVAAAAAAAAVRRTALWVASYGVHGMEIMHVFVGMVR
eukprot:SAG11_NODE_2581_length_3197_cov_3.875403_4_plen_338_part_00